MIVENGDEESIAKQNRRRTEESERRRMKKDGMGARTTQRIIQERAEGKRSPGPLPQKKRRRKHP